ncbi:MAG: hypothetical protein M3410_07190 [Acidobacteriota bacterium]|nr:hypothetical protein [Acidobacteriota bacterium]
MPDPTIHDAFTELFAWCRTHNFAGHDPYDALNSRLFQATPLRHSRRARLAWTQFVKRSPIDLRSICLVPAGRNSKGIALFALAALANYRSSKANEAEIEARQLVNDLLSMRLEGWSGAAWGYNFDWQSRVFFAPRGTPSIVPTAFAARAFIEAAQAFDDETYLKTARSACDFILQDLRRSAETHTEVCFSYLPGSVNRIYNASLLAAETLAGVAALTGEQELCGWAVRAARYVVNQQHKNGSWLYGAAENQAWTDNFHTAYLLTSLARIINHCQAAQTTEFNEALQRGYGFWRASFFLADGWPKYYHDSPYPADAHAAATAVITFLELRGLDCDAMAWAQKIANWSVRNLRDERGFFYYQRRRFYTARTPFMRWTEAWMLYALARLSEEEHVRTASISDRVVCFPNQARSLPLALLKEPRETS